MTTLSSFVTLPQVEQLARGLSFTPREIAQQPETWNVTLGIFQKHQDRICTFLEQLGLLGPIEKRPIVVLVGAGTSDYVGHALSLLLREKWGCEVSACASTDLLTNLEHFVVPERKYLWISFSRSGDSPEGVAVLEQAIHLYPDISHLVVTCNSQARMIEICGKAANTCVVVLDDAVNDRSLAMTSSFTNMVVMGQCLAHAWSLDEYVKIMDLLVPAGRDLLLTAAEEAERTASKHFSRIFMLGSGSLHSIAKESALKVLEMTAGRVKTTSETILGLRHGPMAALDAQTLVVCFVSEEKRNALYAGDLLRELGDKGITGGRIVVGPSWAQAQFASCSESYLAIPDQIGDAYRTVLDVIFGQLLGLYCSVANQLKPDAPSPGGVISRVVQKFRIY